MNILEALVQTRNSIQSWVASNLATKADKDHEHDYLTSDDETINNIQNQLNNKITANVLATAEEV